MAYFGRQQDSLFRRLQTGVQEQTSWLLSTVRNSGCELSDSLFNSTLLVNRPVAFGPQRETELVGPGGVTWA